MNFLKKLFKKPTRVNPVTEPNPEADISKKEMKTAEIYTESQLSGKEDKIKAYDKFGREIYISREQWVNGILKGNLEKHWEEPQELYNIILMAVNDGFHEHVVDAGKQLYKIDTDKERGACMCAIVLMKNKLLTDAESILSNALEFIPNSGVLMTNLAKVYKDQGLHEKSEQVLLRGLTFDPNQDNGLGWYLAIARERGGKEAYHNALLSIAEYEGSWRPQLWLARECLEAGNKEKALKYYAQCFTNTSTPESDLLMQISGDLGNNGHIADIIALVLPIYDIEYHGYKVGNNLIKAYVELERYKEAKALVESLFALNRPDWKKGLSYWDNEIDQKIKHYGPVEDSAKPVIKNNLVSPPCWLYGNKHIDDLAAKKPENAYRVITISASCTRPSDGNAMKVTRTDMEGSICRGFPLAICDSLNLNSTCTASMIVPSIENGGMLFMTHEHSVEDATNIANQVPCDLIILPHLIAEGEYWVMRLKLFKPGGVEPVGILSTTFPTNNPSVKLSDLALKLSQYIQFHNDVEAQASSTQLEHLVVDRYAHYIDANSSCLSLLLAANDEHGGDTLYGERNIFDKLLDLAVDERGSHVFKLMFVWALVKNKAYGSEIYKEYEERVEHFMERVECSDDIKETLEGEFAKLKSPTLTEI